MSSIERKLRSILQDLPVRTLCRAAGIALACALGAHAAQAQDSAEHGHQRREDRFCELRETRLS
jgi:hypothetical protein